jgi:hypothetical protein
VIAQTNPAGGIECGRLGREAKNGKGFIMDDFSSLSQTMQFALLVLVLLGLVCIGRAAKQMRRATFLLVVTLGLIVWHIYAHPEWILQIKEFISTTGGRHTYE